MCQSEGTWKGGVGQTDRAGRGWGVGLRGCPQGLKDGPLNWRQPDRGPRLPQAHPAPASAPTSGPGPALPAPPPPCPSSGLTPSLSSPASSSTSCPAPSLPLPLPLPAPHVQLLNKAVRVPAPALASAPSPQLPSYKSRGLVCFGSFPAACSSDLWSLEVLHRGDGGLGPEKAALSAEAQAKWPEVSTGRYTLSRQQPRAIHVRPQRQINTQTHKGHHQTPACGQPCTQTQTTAARPTHWLHSEPQPLTGGRAGGAPCCPAPHLPLPLPSSHHSRDPHSWEETAAFPLFSPEHLPCPAAPCPNHGSPLPSPTLPYHSRSPLS